MYLNGEEYSHSNDGGAGTGTNGRLCVGSEQYKFRGNMYDFKYYDRLLTAEEVLQTTTQLKEDLIYKIMFENRNYLIGKN